MERPFHACDLLCFSCNMLRLFFNVSLHKIYFNQWEMKKKRGNKLILKLYRFHLWMNYSPEGHRVGLQLDLLGIVLVIWGSNIPSVYFGFYCDEHLQRLYWALVSFPVPTLNYL